MYSKTALLNLCSFLLFVAACKTESVRKVEKIAATGISFSDGSQETINGFLSSDAVTYIIVRHAEKDLSVKDDPPLTTEGKQRSDRILQIIKELPIEKICYTANMRRTYETAYPSINHFNCATEQFSKTAVLPFFLNSLEVFKGKCVLIIGNSNTVPIMLNALKTGVVYPDINEKEYDNLFIVTAKNKDDAIVKACKY